MKFWSNRGQDGFFFFDPVDQFKSRFKLAFKILKL